MQARFKVLGWIMIVVGFVGMICVPMLSKVAMLIRNLQPTLFPGSPGTTNAPDDPLWIVSVAPLSLAVEAVAIAAISVICLTAGYGLLKRKPWARVLTILASVLLLPGAPIATLIGIYGLWLMLSHKGRRVWEELGTGR